MNSIQCIGVSNEKNNRQYSKDNRCRVMVKQDSTRSKLCLKSEKNMCFMHCDCEYCSSQYPPTENRGLIHEETIEQEEQRSVEIMKHIIDNETDIVKLKCLLKAVSEDVSLTSYALKAKEYYRNTKRNEKIRVKIDSLEKEIKKLKEEIK